MAAEQNGNDDRTAAQRQLDEIFQERIAPMTTGTIVTTTDPATLHPVTWVTETIETAEAFEDLDIDPLPPRNRRGGPRVPKEHQKKPAPEPVNPGFFDNYL